MLRKFFSAIGAILVIPVYLFSVMLLLLADCLVLLAVWFMHGDLVCGAFIVRFQDDWILSGAKPRARPHPTLEAAYAAMVFALREQHDRAIARYAQCSRCGAALPPGNSRSGHAGLCCACVHPGGE
jgi:hypothetical protein